MHVGLPGATVTIGLVTLLVIALIVVTGHCTFDGHVGLGLH